MHAEYLFVTKLYDSETRVKSNANSPRKYRGTMYGAPMLSRGRRVPRRSRGSLSNHSLYKPLPMNAQLILQKQCQN